MNIVPARIQEQINRVDRSRAMVLGIVAGLTVLWSVYRLIWLVYSATVLAGVGWSPIALIFPFVLWTAIGVAAAIAGLGFLNRYKQPE
ncbi:hypothetical protein [Mycolicibacterium cosmeticum]|uniref:hypothetical protein n=1 Tax=Mycolicibacterium cosmeticum TaxID=258533 RepID=UPI00040761E3